jgi:hypothetical protein
MYVKGRYKNDDGERQIRVSEREKSFKEAMEAAKIMFNSNSSQSKKGK